MEFNEMKKHNRIHTILSAAVLSVYAISLAHAEERKPKFEAGRTSHISRRMNCAGAAAAKKAMNSPLNTPPKCSPKPD
jgi:hypothetical protein